MRPIRTGSLLLAIPLALAWGCSADPNPGSPTTARLAPASAGPNVQSLDEVRSFTGSISGQSYSFATGDAYAPARALLAASFPGISFGAGAPAVTPASLAGADVFVINPLAMELSPVEACLLGVFVDRGGAVLESRNLGVRPALLGTTPGAGAGVGAPTIVSPASPLIAGPFGTVTAITTGFHYVFASWGDAIPVATALGQPDLLQLDPGPGRDGRAVLIGDEEVFISPSVPGERSGHLASAGNQLLLLNTFAWLDAAPGASPDAPYHRCGFDVLQSTVDALAPAVNRGSLKSLQAKVEAARRQAEFGRADTSAAILGAFLHEVSAMERTARLTPAEASSLEGAAELVLDLL